MRCPFAIAAAASFFAGLALCPGARADIAIPTKSNVSFTLNGKPYTKPVSYTVTCHGQMTWPMKMPKEIVHNESKVFSYSAECKSYPCEVDEDFYMNYRRIDSCDIEGQAGGKPFQVQHFGSSPSGKCESASGGRNCEITFELPEDLDGPAAK